MKKIEIIKINIYLFLIMIIAGYCLCSILALIENILNIIPIPILIVVFCYLIYKVLKNVIEGRI